MPRKQKRRPGGQPGNQNARKHGYYSNATSDEMLAYHEAARNIKGLDGEIAFLRVKIASIEAHDPGNYSLLLTAASALERLVRTQKALDGSERRVQRRSEFCDEGRGKILKS